MIAKVNVHPVTPAEKNWLEWLMRRDSCGLTLNDAELTLMREVIARWQAADAARAQAQSQTKKVKK